MNASRNNLSATNIELTVEVSLEEMNGFSQRAAQKLSEQVKIEGFRPGKAPYDVVRAKLGDMAILEEAARIAVSKTIDEALKQHVTEEWIGQPEITVIKLAPENPFEYRALLTLLPSVELGDYKGLSLERPVVAVSEEDVNRVITQLRNARVREAAVDRPAGTGDKVIVDAKLFLDKVPVEGGQANETAVIIGKDYFVPGFDEKIAGMKAGDTREFTLHYPSDHYQKMLAGKDVEFSVTAKQVFSRELPEVDGTFVAAFGLKSAEELTDNIRKNIEQEKKSEAEMKLEQEMLDAIVAKATISELPDSVLHQESHTMLHELESNVVRAGMKFDDYLTSIGKTKAALEEELRPQAERRVKTSLVLRQIMKQEEIAVSDAEIEAELSRLKAQYAGNREAQEALSSPAYRRHAEATILNRRVIDRLKEWNLKPEAV